MASCRLTWLALPAALCLALGGCAKLQSTKPGAPTPATTPQPAENTAPAGADLLSVEREALEAYQRQDWATSEKNFVLLTQKIPAESEPWFKLGNIYARTERPELAVRAYREAVIRDPEHSRAWHNMGVVQLKQAAASFKELQKFADPDDPLYARGVELGNAIDGLVKPKSGDAP